MVVFESPFQFHRRHSRQASPHRVVDQTPNLDLVEAHIDTEGQISGPPSPTLSGTNTPDTDPGILFESSNSGRTTPGTEPEILFTPDLESSESRFVLVTGGLGFIGSHTVLELMKIGHNVLIVDDLSNSNSDIFDRILKTADIHLGRNGGRCPTAHFHNMDYRDEAAMRVLLEAYNIPSSDVPSSSDERRSSIMGVIHFAAFKAVEESIRQPLRYYHNNISGLIDFVDLLGQYNIKTFIFSSSATVYGALADGSRLLREEHCTHDLTLFSEDGTTKLTQSGYTGITNPYGRTKFFGEAILSDLATSDPTWTIIALRYFNPVGCDSEGLLGEDPKGVPANLLPVVTKVLTGQMPQLMIYGDDWDTPDGTAVRDFIHVTDLAKGHTAALGAAQIGRMAAGFRTFNLGVGRGNSVMEVVSTMEKVSGASIARKVTERRAGDAQSSVANADRARRELGWKTDKQLWDACQDICNYLRLRNDFHA